MNLKRTTVVALVVVAVITIGGFAISPGVPIPTSAQVASALLPPPTFTPIFTSTATAIPSDTPTATSTSTSTPTATPTLTSTPTLTPAPTRTRTPTGTINPTLRVARVPILMYHYISVPPPDADKYRLDLSVTPDAFETQMDYLAINGYHPIRLVDLTEYLLHGSSLPDKPVVLTFDDGYSDIYANAFPTLRNHNFQATFFIITQFVNENRWGYVNWAQLDEMARAGMEIGSHSQTHPDLKGKSRTFQISELAGSKQTIEGKLGTVVLSFSYPAGKYDANTTAALTAAGYLAAVTEIQGARQASNNMDELQRIRIRGSYSILDFDKWIKWFVENGK